MSARPAKRAGVALAALAAALLLIWKAGYTAGQVVEDRLRATAQERLTLYASTLDAAFTRLRHLPFTPDRVLEALAS